MRGNEYPAQVFWSDEDDAYIAVAPDLPGCSAFGDSKTEALAELEHAIEAWIEAARAAGNLVPEPSAFSGDLYSGKLVVRMPKSLHRDLANCASIQGVSLNQYIVFLLGKNNALEVYANNYNTNPSPRWSLQRITSICHNGQPIKSYGEVATIDFGYAASLINTVHQQNYLEATNG